MESSYPLWTIAAAVLLLNLPFGYWRAGVSRFSVPWFLAVHAPIPAVIAIRVMSGLGWRFSTFPALIGAFFAGQLLGGLCNRKNRKKQDP